MIGGKIMKIIRDKKEFTLTEQELLNAYLEQQELFDKKEITDSMEDYLSMELYDLLKDNKEYLYDATQLYRKYYQNYQMEKEFALKEAIVDAAAIFLPKKNGENDD